MRHELYMRTVCESDVWADQGENMYWANRSMWPEYCTNTVVRQLLPLPAFCKCVCEQVSNNSFPRYNTEHIHTRENKYAANTHCNKHKLIHTLPRCLFSKTHTHAVEFLISLGCYRGQVTSQNNSHPIIAGYAWMIRNSSTLSLLTCCSMRQDCSGQ